MKRIAILSSLVALPFGVLAACGGSSSTDSSVPDSGVVITNGLDGSQVSGFDGSTSIDDSGVLSTDDAAAADDASALGDASAVGDATAEAGKILAEGLSDPIPYTSRADSPFNGVSFPVYLQFEDWEDGVVNTLGVTASSAGTGGGSLADSVDGDDGVVDGKCLKEGGTCNSGFSGSGVISFTFNAAALGGQLPSHVGIVWTDGSPACNAIFEAYDANDGLVDASAAMIGTKTATAVGDGNNTGGVAEDRFFSVVHAAGVKRIVVKSSAGGVEVDHLQYGR